MTLQMPLALTGALTVVAVVGLGLFVYPEWLRSSAGRLGVVLATPALSVCFYWFDGGRTTDATLRGVVSLLLALIPLAAGLDRLPVRCAALLRMRRYRAGGAGCGMRGL
jgi:hypothetical protein